VIDNNIISIEISIKIIFFLFKTKPSIPIKNKIKDKFIVKNNSIFNDFASKRNRTFTRVIFLFKNKRVKSSNTSFPRFVPPALHKELLFGGGVVGLYRPFSFVQFLKSYRFFFLLLDSFNSL
jgi:hypothetical protein